MDEREKLRALVKRIQDFCLEDGRPYFGQILEWIAEHEGHYGSLDLERSDGERQSDLRRDGGSAGPDSG